MGRSCLLSVSLAGHGVNLVPGCCAGSCCPEKEDIHQSREVCFSAAGSAILLLFVYCKNGKWILMSTATSDLSVSSKCLKLLRTGERKPLV